MKITNLQIYQTFTNLKSLDNFTQYIPARANFFLQKNDFLKCPRQVLEDFHSFSLG